LKDARVAELLVVDVMRPVIEWHEKGMVPLGETLTGDPRCRLVEGDFFAMAGDPAMGFDPEQPGRKFHAVLLDIDHSPQNLLDEKNAVFYSADGLRCLANQLLPGGVFALWSDDAPDEDFMKRLGEVFDSSQAHVVKFPNPLLERDSESTVYVARKRTA
jgi:spermidine synthase